MIVAGHALFLPTQSDGGRVGRFLIARVALLVRMFLSG